MDRYRQRRRMQEMDRELGRISAAATFMITGMVLGVFAGSPVIMLGSIVAFGLAVISGPIMKGLNMIKAIQRLIGVTECQGKLSALATHLKVRFNLIPEHWDVEKIKQGS